MSFTACWWPVRRSTGFLPFPKRNNERKNTERARIKAGHHLFRCAAAHELLPPPLPRAPLFGMRGSKAAREHGRMTTEVTP